jgi:acyl-CoA hydrolase
MHDAISRIVTVLEPGAGVVTSRADVHYVITEHGIANLHGKTLRERALALIAIADPRFQQELEDFAVRAHYLEHNTVAPAFS